MKLSIYTKLTDTRGQRGTIYPGGYGYYALVFGQPSQFGIEGGRVSKLQVHDGQGRQIINYERGWDIKPGLFPMEAPRRPAGDSRPL